MRKFPIIMLTFTLLLAACVPAATTPATPLSPASVTNTPLLPECRLVNLKPTPGPEVPSLFPPISEDDHVLGPADASVTVLEYADFQCPTCAGLAPVLALLGIEYPQDFRLVFRHFPLLHRSDYDKTALAAQAAEAAAAQGKFWEMHDLLYGKQSEWKSLSPADFERWLYDQTALVGLDLAQFQADLNSAAIVTRVQQAWEDGLQTGLPYTPFLLINGQIYTGPIDYNSLKQIVSLIILGNRQVSTCPPMTVDPLKQYIATLHTEKGDFVIQLYPDKAPLAVNSFVFLARNGWYDNITFHRVIPGFYIQTGDPSGTDAGGPGYFFVDEIDPSLHFDRPGVVAMFNTGADTNGSQFFITLVPAPQMDGMYTIFGQVISGIEVLALLTPRDPMPGITLPPGDILFSVTIEER